MCNRNRHSFFFLVSILCPLDGLCLWTRKCGYTRTEVLSPTTNWRRVLERERESAREDLFELFSRSFSYVFEASNTADSHRYAVKKMSCHTHEEEKRARDELQNYQRFSHPNLGSNRTFFLPNQYFLSLVSLLYHEQVQYSPTAHITSTVWLVFPYFKVNECKS